MSHEGGASPTDFSVSASRAGASATLLRLIRQGRSFSGHEPHCCFLNTGKQRFADVSAASGLNFPDDGRAVGVVDWDHDGDLDLWIVNRNAPQVRFLRNDVPSDNQFVALRLKSTSGNRDAIGASVEVIVAGDGSAKQIQSLNAGNGYLSQSSKWLHFGLGDATTIQRVIVHWPNGEAEQFTGIEPNRRYVLTESSAKPESWTPPRNDASLALSPNDLTESKVEKSSSQIEVLSATQPPLPRLSYTKFDGTQAAVFTPGESYVLMTLWASNCVPCLEELADLSQQEKNIRSAGIEVRALSVDGLDDSSGLGPKTASDLLEQMKFPFDAGMASARLVELLQTVNNHMFDLHIRLPVPTSILIDDQGRLAAIYKGRLSIERLLGDLKILKQSAQPLRDETIPFKGRWHEPRQSLSVLPLLRQFVDQGFLPEADEYARRLVGVSKQQLLPELAHLGITLLNAGHTQQAQSHFTAIGRIDPTFVDVELALGLANERRGSHPQAITLYREALRRNKESMPAKNNLAWLLATSPDDQVRDGQEALKLALAIAMEKKDDPNSLDTLAAAYAEVGNYPAAIKTVRRSMTLYREQGRLLPAQQGAEKLTFYERSKPYRSGE